METIFSSNNVNYHHYNVNLNNQGTLDDFLKNWDIEYKLEASHIDLFKRDFSTKINKEQRQRFIKMFYHSRGHFKDFLWHMGNYAPNNKYKKIILKNIEEEFNNDDKSHEKLYLDYAKNEGVDLSNEYINNNFHSPKMEAFNKLHLFWLYSHSDWISKFSAFSAYERLDSTDYELLSRVLFQNLKNEHEFFKIHRQATHFDKTYDNLAEMWIENKNLVEEAFIFIAQSQLNMWRDLSSEILLFS